MPLSLRSLPLLMSLLAWRNLNARRDALARPSAAPARRGLGSVGWRDISPSSDFASGLVCAVVRPRAGRDSLFPLKKSGALVDCGLKLRVPGFVHKRRV